MCGRVKIRVETRPSGKKVTIVNLEVASLPFPVIRPSDLLKTWKKDLACNGCFSKNTDSDQNKFEILLQGDCSEWIRANCISRGIVVQP